MARKLRIQYEGAMYHVMSRGDKDELIFPADNTKNYFVKLLKEGSARYQVDIYAYCVMGTHYHVLIQINKVNLSDFMHYLSSAYANYLVRNGWFGHVFSGRYKAILVEREEYLLTVNRYIHLNPVSAGLVERPEDYRWSSYPLYFRRGKSAAWLKMDWIAEYFGPVEGQAVERYREFIMAGMENPSDYPHDKVVANAILGSERFLRGILSYLQEAGRMRDLTERKMLARRLSLDDVAKGIVESSGVADLATGDYRRDEGFKYACDLFIFMAREYTPSSYQEISEVLGGVSPNAISHRYLRVKEEIQADGVYRKRIDDDIERIVSHIIRRVP